MTTQERPGRDDAERTTGQHAPVHETPAEPGNYDSNERADDAVEVVEPDGSPTERHDG